MLSLVIPAFGFLLRQRLVCRDRIVHDVLFLLLEFFKDTIDEFLDRFRRSLQRIFQTKAGHSFMEELLIIRMNTAEYLLQHSNMTLEEIATHVGYQTFAGFWKARKKYLKMQKETQND